MLSKLPFGQASKEDAHADEKEQSLTTILRTAEDRANLLVLVVGCTEAMRARILATFDPEKTGGTISAEDKAEVEDEDGAEIGVIVEAAGAGEAGGEPEGGGGDGNGDGGQTSREAEAKLAKSKGDGVPMFFEGMVVADEEDGKDGTEEEKEARRKRKIEEQKARERERRVKELATPRMQELKKAALEYFDDWRDKVIGRVGGAVNKREEEEDTRVPETGAFAAELKDEERKIERKPLLPRRPSPVDEVLDKVYTIQETPLLYLSDAKRVLIVHSLLLLLLSLEKYPAESRTLLVMMTRSLKIPLKTINEDENKVAQGLLEAAKMNADEETKKKAQQGSVARKWKVGLGAVAGAAIIGVTGGLAAPLLAAGVGTVMGGLGLGTTAAATYLGAMAGSAPLIGILFGSYGGMMTSKMVDQYAKEVSDFAFLPVHEPPRTMLGAKKENEVRRLRVAIGISGYLTKEDEALKPWMIMGPSMESFALRWELKALLDLGSALTDYVKSAAWGWAKKEIITRTVFGALSAGLWPLGLVNVSKVFDNPFSVARSRSEKAGEVLADALINKVQGERPVTLVGYSLGARLIYSCLTTLADRKAFGLIENVILIGAPTPSDSVHWRKMRTVVAGRLVNVYSTNDYLLGFMYRTSSLQYGIAGLQPIVDVEGVENVDVSDIVEGHTKYRYLTGRLLKQIAFEDVNAEELAQEERDFKQQEELEENERGEDEQKVSNVDEAAEKLQKQSISRGENPPPKPPRPQESKDTKHEEESEGSRPDLPPRPSNAIVMEEND